ncbi:MAG: septum formation initiator family protein [Deltaproteobacteria bacterium]|nr:septum formation initiator family protein [Deltaproteobacteria bacterium]
MIKLFSENNWKLFCALGLVIVGAFVFLTLLGNEGLLRLRDLYRMKQKIQAENQLIFNTNQKLKEEVSLLKEQVFAERLVREKLGYVKPKEYILILDRAQIAETQPVPANPSRD